MNAYSLDLREKIVEAVLGRKMGKSEVARTFGVSLSSVKRYISMSEEGHSLAPKKRLGLRPKLDDRARRLLRQDVSERPFPTHSKRCEYLKAVAGVSVSNSTVCRELKRMENTRKKGA
jgi:transposase